MRWFRGGGAATVYAKCEWRVPCAKRPIAQQPADWVLSTPTHPGNVCLKKRKAGATMTPVSLI
jgi:hypothetical protein